MNVLLDSYYQARQRQLFIKIDEIINPQTLEAIAQNIFANNYLIKRGLIRGHRYYLEVTGQIRRIKRQPRFMHTFKRRYGLQYIDTGCLDYLEANKKYIINNVVKRPFKVYSTFFAQACVIQNGEEKRKKLTSFFTKLAHTVSPSHFSALDNPIRKYFKIDNESFFVSYALLNDTYSQWISKRKGVIKKLRNLISDHDNDNLLRVYDLEALKILDMIFWFKANKEQ